MQPSYRIASGAFLTYFKVQTAQLLAAGFAGPRDHLAAFGPVTDGFEQHIRMAVQGHEAATVVDDGEQAEATQPVSEYHPAAEDGSASMTQAYITLGLAGAAAFTTAVSILGAGMAVGRIGSAALGAASEHPELLTRSLLFVALAEGLAVLGFAVAMLMVMRIPA